MIDKCKDTYIIVIWIYIKVMFKFSQKRCMEGFVFDLDTRRVSASLTRTQDMKEMCLRECL